MPPGLIITMLIFSAIMAGLAGWGIIAFHSYKIEESKGPYNPNTKTVSCTIRISHKGILVYHDMMTCSPDEYSTKAFLMRGRANYWINQEKDKKS